MKHIFAFMLWPALMSAMVFGVVADQDEGNVTSVVTDTTEMYLWVDVNEQYSNVFYGWYFYDYNNANMIIVPNGTINFNVFINDDFIQSGKNEITDDYYWYDYWHDDDSTYFYIANVSVSDIPIGSVLRVEGSFITEDGHTFNSSDQYTILGRHQTDSGVWWTYRISDTSWMKAMDYKKGQGFSVGVELYNEDFSIYPVYIKSNGRLIIDGYLEDETVYHREFDVSKDEFLLWTLYLTGKDFIAYETPRIPFSDLNVPEDTYIDLEVTFITDSGYVLYDETTVFL